MNPPEPLRRLGRRIARAYYLLCARDERLRRGLALPTGVWACQLCRRISFDQGAHILHVAVAH